jgi:hypothetical protein
MIEMKESVNMALRTTFFSLLLITGALVFASAALAQTDTINQPATLLDALDLPVCAEYLLAAQPVVESGVSVGAEIAPEDAETRSVLVFSFDGMQAADVITLMSFESEAAIADKAAALNLTPLSVYLEGSAPLPANPGPYGWMVLFYDAEGEALCRSTGYPAAAGETQALDIVSVQGFIAQVVSSKAIDLSRYQVGDTCTFDTPQFCETIFMGDQRAEIIDGTAGADLIRGAAGDDTISGNDGDDVIDGGDGDDVLMGGDGNDVITGGDGGDDLHGGDGDDIIFGGDGDDVIHGDQGLDTVDGEEGADTVDQD